MKKLISNHSGEALELAKRIMYSLKVLVIGLFIPFTFIFGITYNRHSENTVIRENTKPQKVIDENTVVLSAKTLPDQKS